MGSSKLYSLVRFLSDYWNFLEGRRTRFIFFASIRTSSSMAPFAIAYCVGKIIDFFLNYKGGSLKAFYLLLCAITVLGIVQVWLRMVAKLELYKISAEIRKEARIRAMEKMIDLELEWHDEEGSGSKIEKINNGSSQVYEAMKKFANEGMEIITGIAGSMTIFLTLSWKYALFAIVYTWVCLYGEYHMNKRISITQDALNKAKEMVSDKIHESASNLVSVKSLGMKGAFMERTKDDEEMYYTTWLDTVKVNQVKTKSLKIFGAACYASFIALLGFDALQGIITAGSIYVYASYFGRLSGAIDTLSNSMNEFIKIKSGVGRFMTLLGQETEDRENGRPDIPRGWRSIEFSGLHFDYKDKAVLDDFSLSIRRNEVVGIVGESGCGKSTLAKLLLGLYCPKRGKIMIGGKEIRAYKNSSITLNISVVLQDSEMFNMTLMDNIMLSSLKKSRKRLKMAIETANLHSVIRKLPQGINTTVGEKGYRLSGGERQRIGIARAVYKDAPIMILDEATSSLDSKTEKEIQKSIERLKDKTLIIIAHRISTLKNADRIVVMAKGRIVEEGRFDELVNKQGKFFELYKIQNNIQNSRINKKLKPSALSYARKSQQSPGALQPS